MREWPNRTVSKTVVSQGTVGSNPTPSARGQEWSSGSGLRVRTGDHPPYIPHQLANAHRSCHGRNDARATTGPLGTTRSGWTRPSNGEAPGDQQDWASSGLTDIHHQGHSPGMDVQHGDHGEKEPPHSPVVH